MLDVSFNLAAVIVMLFGIGWPGHSIEVDFSTVQPLGQFQAAEAKYDPVETNSRSI
jgi:hypothetical protein